jgi:hypothetical protein
MPRKVVRANPLSPYGAERKRPAGERVWRQAAVKAILGLRSREDGIMRRTIE